PSRRGKREVDSCPRMRAYRPYLGAKGDLLKLGGEGPRVAARQGATLFALAGALALVGTAAQPDRSRVLVGVAVADLGVAALAWWLPWHRYPARAPLALSVPAFVILAASTWAFGGMAAGTGPFLVLVYA